MPSRLKLGKIIPDGSEGKDGLGAGAPRPAHSRASGDASFFTAKDAKRAKESGVDRGAGGRTSACAGMGGWRQVPCCFGGAGPIQGCEEDCRRMLSQKARYALRALVELAREPATQRTAGQIATRTDAPRKFLEAILLELARRGLVVSRRGKLGGYALARAPELISFAEVIRVIDGPLALAPCVSKTAFRKCHDCPEDLARCALRQALLRARDATAHELEGYSLADAAAIESAAQPAEM